MKNLKKVIGLSMVALFLSSHAAGSSKSPEVKAAAKVEKKILKVLEKDLKEIAKTLDEAGKKDLTRSFRYFRKLEKHNDEFIASYDETVSGFSLFSSEAQRQILIDGLCPDHPELEICIPEVTFEFSVGEAVYYPQACVNVSGDRYGVYMLPEPGSFTFYVNDELKYVQQESQYMDYLFYNAPWSSWYGFASSGLYMTVGQTISSSHGDEYAHLALVSVTENSIEMRLVLGLQYTDPDTGESDLTELVYDLNYDVTLGSGGGFSAYCEEEEEEDWGEEY